MDSPKRAHFRVRARVRYLVVKHVPPVPGRNLPYLALGQHLFWRVLHRGVKNHSSQLQVAIGVGILELAHRPDE